jgi:Holliday junction resolvasome RuvABC endonuclease subunit
MPYFVGSDPGDSNYGYCVLKANTAKGILHLKIIEIGMFTCQINNLTDKPAKPPKSKRRKRTKIMYPPFEEQLKLYSREWINILNTFKPKKLTTERFQARGLRGKSIEAVSIMNGASCLIAQSKHVDFEMITAATWKNQINGCTNLEEIYDLVDGLTPHSIDACFLAVYGVLKYFKLKWDDVPYASIIEQFKLLEMDT